MTPEQKVRAYFALFEEASDSSINQLVHEDYVLEDAQLGLVFKDREAFRAAVNQEGNRVYPIKVIGYFGDDLAGAVHVRVRWPTKFIAGTWGLPTETDLEAIRPAFDGQDFVVHLAATSSLEYTWEEILYPNVIGTYNVFEAARQAHVKRVVFASSGSITTGWERDEPYKAIVQGRYEDVPPSWPMITHETQPRPFGLYGCSKLWGEGLARHYSDTSDLSIICIRIGEVVEENRPTNNRRFSMWCSHRDLVQMVSRCINAPDELRFDVFYAVSDNKWNYRDTSHARDIVGYEPEDQAESYRR